MEIYDLNPKDSNMQSLTEGHSEAIRILEIDSYQWICFAFIQHYQSLNLVVSTN